MAVVASMKKRLKASIAWAIAKGAFLKTLPPDPRLMLGLATVPKLSRKKRMEMTQKAGWRS